MERVSLVFLHLKLVQIVEILLSGFEMDLYLPDEAPFLYWYLVGVLSRQKDVLSILLKAIEEQAESGEGIRYSAFSGFFLRRQRQRSRIRLPSISGSLLRCTPEHVPCGIYGALVLHSPFFTIIPLIRVRTAARQN